MVLQLRLMTEAWANSVREDRLGTQEAWLALGTTILKSVEYTLPALTLTEKAYK